MSSPLCQWLTLMPPTRGTSLFGRPADNLPMDGLLVEWRLTETGWIQVHFDAARAGSGLLNFAVDELERHVAEVSRRGLAPDRSRRSTSSWPPFATPTATPSHSSGTSASTTEMAAGAAASPGEGRPSGPIEVRPGP